jgi:hypothetical protein
MANPKLQRDPLRIDDMNRTLEAFLSREVIDISYYEEATLV